MKPDMAADSMQRVGVQYIDHEDFMRPLRVHIFTGETLWHRRLIAEARIIAFVSYEKY